MIKKHRKKFKTIEVVQFKRENFDEIKKWSNGTVHNIKIPKCIGGIAECELKTSESKAIILEDDYIIKKTNGDYVAMTQLNFKVFKTFCKPVLKKKKRNIVIYYIKEDINTI